MTTVPQIRIADGVTIPQLGFGVYQVPPEETRDAVSMALEVGYRHIDTAQMYGNEQGVGDALKDSGLSRDEVFVTSKLNNGFHRRDDALRAAEASVERLGGPMDLFLIHWPLPTIDVDYLETWQAMIEIRDAGLTRAIGVSNFQVPHLERIIAETGVKPAVNQIEVHPYLTNETVRAYNAAQGIATEAWSPIAQGQVLGDPTISAIAERVGRTTAQVTLRWHIQRGDIVFPKSVTRSRVEENFRLFDFELTDDDIQAIAALNKDHRTGPDPDTFAYIPA
ncbi:aldo/keto reductase [Microbacterium sediminis]|uniref:Oxidoreductase n=1 Tax=Microbacterium sediminis TaxID=904291 RepID=A0A1B9NIN1_9MICO|nr:aldo/keto reductase [Microbacterium sediminis]OCG76469.1 oxidoreductase [Microbacterium sediminis]QBR73045.1 aldo/keto reductase [Microbacterium sediminis]